MGYKNPLLDLPAAREIIALPPSPEKKLLIKLLGQLRKQADEKAVTSWDRRKAPMACYYRVTSTYARHTAHVLKQKG